MRICCDLSRAEISNFLCVCEEGLPTAERRLDETASEADIVICNVQSQ